MEDVASARPYRVCVVCSGNICRSPMGEVVLRAAFEEVGLGDDVEVDSAGTGAWHVGDQADHRALQALTGRGYDGSRHRAREFEPAWLSRRDLVLVADRRHHADLLSMAATPQDADRVRYLREFDPAARAAGDLDLADPYYGDRSGFEECLRQVVDAAAGIVEHVRLALSARPHTSGEVASRS